MIKVLMRQVAETKRNIDAIDDRIKKAYQSAAKGAGYQLSLTMKQEIRKGAPGGRRFDALTHMRRYRAGRLSADKPYLMPHGKSGSGGMKMGNLIFYNAEAKDSSTTVSVGWVDTKKIKLSRRYKELASSLQTGRSGSISQRQREYFARIGGGMSKRSRSRKYFFLKKSTTRFKTPGRQVIEPFWGAHEQSAFEMIRNNFRKKMAGENF